LEAGGVCLSPECWCKHRIGHGSPPAKPNIAARIDAGDPARWYNDRRVQRLEDCRTDEMVGSRQLRTPIHGGSGKASLGKPDFAHPVASRCGRCGQLPQLQFAEAANGGEPERDELHRLHGGGMAVGLAVLFVEISRERIEARARHRASREWYGQLVGLTPIA